jgi:SAM-dependent methyltransferase
MSAVGTQNEATRIRWVAAELQKIGPGARILDAGAGERRYEQFCQHLTYVAQDFGKYDGKGDGAGLHPGEWDQTRLDIVSDIAAIPEPNESFDAIMCIEVFEHLPNPIPAIREFHRLLKPGGTLLLTAPFCSLSHFAPYHFSTGFNRYFYEHHLPEQGFDVGDIRINGNFFEFLAQEILRIPEVSQRYSVWDASRIERWAIRLILNMLGRLSKNDRGSGEFLCFGYHVRAHKRERG